MLEVHPDKLNMGWNALAWGAALGDLGDKEDVKIVYAVDTVALEKQHLHKDIPYFSNQKETTSYSPAHMLCIQRNPEMPLIRFLIGRIPFLSIIM